MNSKVRSNDPQYQMQVHNLSHLLKNTSHRRFIPHLINRNNYYFVLVFFLCAVLMVESNLNDVWVFLSS